jgi:hypothetical protein
VVATDRAGTRPPDDTRLLAWLSTSTERLVGAADAGREVVDLATAALRRACPIVTGLLAFDDRLREEIVRQLALPTTAFAVPEWGAEFARRLAADADPWIAWAALVDAGTLKVAASRPADASCPGDPVQAILLITAGTDPRA